MDPIRKIPRKFTKKFGSKLLIDNIFVERLGFSGRELFFYRTDCTGRSKSLTQKMLQEPQNQKTILQDTDKTKI